MTLPEFYDNRIVEWEYHVAESLGVYDMIIGRDMLSFLGIDIRFSNHTVEWGTASIPFKDVAQETACFHVEEPEHLQEATKRLQKILEAKYEPADLEKVCGTRRTIQRRTTEATSTPQ